MHNVRFQKATDDCRKRLCKITQKETGRKDFPARPTIPLKLLLMVYDHIVDRRYHSATAGAHRYIRTHREAARRLGSDTQPSGKCSSPNGCQQNRARWPNQHVIYLERIRCSCGHRNIVRPHRLRGTGVESRSIRLRTSGRNSALHVKCRIAIGFGIDNCE